MTAAAIGRLMKKTSRQDTALISQPPRNGPIAVATPPSPDQAPMAFERSSGANDACRIARLPGVSSAAPDPLQRPGRDQEPGVRRQAAGERREREPDRADHEDLPPAVRRRRARRRAAAGRPAGACSRRRPTACWRPRRGSRGRSRAARCPPRWRQARRCRIRAPWPRAPSARCGWRTAGRASRPSGCRRRPRRRGIFPRHAVAVPTPRPQSNADVPVNGTLVDHGRGDRPAALAQVVSDLAAEPPRLPPVEHRARRPRR